MKRYKGLGQWLISFVFLLLLGFVTTAVHSQDSGQAASQVQKEQAGSGDVAALFQELDRLEQEIGTIKQQLVPLKGEDRLILSKQAKRLKGEYRKAMSKLLGQLVSRRSDEGDIKELVERIRPRSEKLASTLRQDIAAIQSEIQTLRGKRDAAAPEELLQLQEQLSEAINHNSDLILALFEHNEKMAAIGLDATNDMAFLDKVLQERAEAISGRIELFLEQQKALEKRASSLPDADKKSLDAELLALGEKKQINAKSLAVTVDIMAKRGLDTTRYSQLLILATGEIRGDIFDRKVVMGLSQQWLEAAQEWVIQHGPAVLLKGGVILVILLFFKLLSGLAGRLVRRTLSTSKLNISKLLQDFFINLSSKAVMLVGLLVALSQIGVQVGPLLAGLGVVGFIVGFALQDTLSNFASGLMILIYRPYDVGNTIEAGGVMGKVQEMNMVSTTVMTPDNQKLVVPNNKIWGGVIRNVTAQDRRRVDMVFGIGYGDDMAKAEAILRTIVEQDARVLKDPAPIIKVHTLGESSVDFVVRPWVSTPDYWDVYWDITRKVKEEFDAQGVSIPFPQRDVHIIGQPGQA